MARVLIVGCGCRGRELAAALVGDGHAVRGTSRTAAHAAEMEAAGAEAVVADPDRLATLLPHVQGVTVLCWLLGRVPPPAGDALHGPRLESMLEALVDTPVRGLVYEGPGEAIARRFAATFRMPVELLRADPGDHAAWLGEARAAVGTLLG